VKSFIKFDNYVMETNFYHPKWCQNGNSSIDCRSCNRVYRCAICSRFNTCNFAISKDLSFFIPLIFCYFGFKVFIFLLATLFTQNQQITLRFSNNSKLCQNAYIALVSYFFPISLGIVGSVLLISVLVSIMFL
jgi:hypothetical protein